MPAGLVHVNVAQGITVVLRVAGWLSDDLVVKRLAALGNLRLDLLEHLARDHSAHLVQNDSVFRRLLLAVLQPRLIGLAHDLDVFVIGHFDALTHSPPPALAGRGWRGVL
ncbi:hypothetical protein D9M69_720850 [compost metagenome]